MPSFESQPVFKPLAPSPALMQPRPKQVALNSIEIDPIPEVERIIQQLGDQSMIYDTSRLRERVVRSHPAWSSKDASTVFSALGDDPRVESVGDAFLLYRVFPGGPKSDEAQAFIADEGRWRNRLSQVIGRVVVPTGIHSAETARFTDRCVNRYAVEWGRLPDREFRVVRLWAESYMHEPEVFRSLIQDDSIEPMPRYRLLQALHDFRTALTGSGPALTSYDQLQGLTLWDTADERTEALFVEQLPRVMNEAGFESMSKDSGILIALPAEGDHTNFLRYSRRIHASAEDIIQQHIDEGWMSISETRLTEQLRTVLDVPPEHAALPLACLQNHPLLRRQEDNPGAFTIVQEGPEVIRGRILTENEIARGAGSAARKFRR